MVYYNYNNSFGILLFNKCYRYGILFHMRI